MNYKSIRIARTKIVKINRKTGTPYVQIIVSVVKIVLGPEDAERMETNLKLKSSVCSRAFCMITVRVSCRMKVKTY